ncbi:MAG: LacI family transcriptional regulator [Spirochaetaceae bacterium]|nr:MAG: LacI family transcriptional regulator [Spirochaetaceae bacterium]
MSSRQSIRDVAKAAGVSITTVSRVMNTVDYPVSAELRERVIEAARQLNYSPNRSAQSLRKNAVDVIGLIVRDIDYSYFGQIARGVTESALDQGCMAFVCNTGRKLEKEYAYHELLWQHRVKGIVIAGGGVADARYAEIVTRQTKRMQAAGLKVVALAPQGAEMPCLGYDHQALGRRMTEYLLGIGHQDIGFLAGPSSVVTSQRHVCGYRSAIEEAGGVFRESLVACGAFSEEGGDKTCRQLLDGSIPFTALCAGNDDIAIGAIHALRERGLRVPEDVSIVGVGNTPTSRYTRPQLTTFDTFRYQTGVRAVQYVLSEIPAAEWSENQIAAACPTPQLIERNSVAAR